MTNTRPTLVTDELVERLREWLKAIAELAQSPDVDPLAFMDLAGKGAAGLHGELAAMPTLVTGQLEEQDTGGISGAREPDPSFTGSGPPGFDPGRCICGRMEGPCPIHDPAQLGQSERTGA